MYRKILLALLLAGTLSATATAQTTDDQARDDLDYYSSTDDRFQDNAGGDIWWGTGAILGYNASNFNSLFRIGITPIVGYKINNFLSIGPRASLTYNAYRESFAGGQADFKANYVEWSAGPFVRAKVFQQFFAHAEYSLVNEAETFNQDGSANRITRAIPYLGGGLNQGGGPGMAGFEVLILFRLSGADRIGDAPFELRTGVNFNF